MCCTCWGDRGPHQTMKTTVFTMLCAMFSCIDLADSIDIRNNSSRNTTANVTLATNHVTSVTGQFGKYGTDVAVYLSYSFDPFGPSRRIVNAHHRNRSSLATAAELWDAANVVDTGRASGSGGKPGPPQRPKRGVLHLYNMVKCATGCNPVSYKGYGCYCGFLGSGQPVDGIDRCCKFHDWCYDSAGCPPLFTYVMPYYWRCYRNKAYCAVDHGEFGGAGSCAQRLCECDRILSDCLSRYPCPRSRAVCYSSPWRLLQNKLMIF